ncbi:MAG TPA: hypothetical protein VFI99_04335 [Nocardioides sp.]|nr:hypothetical protein [Nocardioides sp.]
MGPWPLWTTPRTFVRGVDLLVATIAPCRAITSPSSATRSMQEFCTVKRSAVVDSRFEANKSLRMVLL